MPTVRSIIIRPSRKAEPVRLSEALITTTGIEGDHYAKEEGLRQVTLIAEDDLATIAAIVGFQGDAHLASRRNIMVDSLPVKKLKGRIISIGNEVKLEITGYCSPCFRMDENFGTGAVSAFAQKAGWVAKVINEGMISVGDPLIVD